MGNYVLDIRTMGDSEKGYLSFYEIENDVPFPIKRIYYTYDVPINVKRGLHAHKKLQQIMWCPYGEIEVILDDGEERVHYLLDCPEKGLVVLNGYWREMIWRKEGSVLCVAASDFYDESDYIRNYDEFLKLVGEGYWKNENKLQST